MKMDVVYGSETSVYSRSGSTKSLGGEHVEKVVGGKGLNLLRTTDSAKKSRDGGPNAL